MTWPMGCQMIAPICADCGQEIDKTPAGWVHVGTPRDPLHGGLSRESQAEMDAIIAAHERGTWRVSS